MIPFLRISLAILFFPLALQATIVTTSADEDDGSLGGKTGISLREAVKYSVAGDTISFTPALSDGVIRLTAGELTISKSLTIDGSTLLNPITLTGDKTGNGTSSDDTRIFNITNGIVILDSLILDRGYCQSGTGKHGAAIHVNNTTTQLTLRNCVLSNNESTTYGGGIYFIGALDSPVSFIRIQNSHLAGNHTGHNGGAVHVSGTLHIENSTFSNNIAYMGCAIFNAAGATTVESSTFSGSAAHGYGGAIYNQDTFTLRESTISGNSAPRGGGIYSAGGTLVIEDSTLSGNSANRFGGGIHAKGVLNLSNTTLAENTATTSGGGLYCNAVTASLVHTTISANFSTGSDGGIYNDASSALSLSGSIVAGNTAPTAPDLAGTFTGTNNLTNGNPFLASLGDYGGPTFTMPPLPDSPAIDALALASLPTDQRGFPRDLKPDIGAAEYQSTDDLARFWHLDPDGDGSPYGVEQALGTDNFTPDCSSSRNLGTPIFHAPGLATLSFGLSSSAVSGTRWILKRSPDLSPGSFVEIYHTDRTTDTASPSVTFVRTSTGVTVTDSNPFPGDGFYRFEAQLAP
jgi:predicted outer membrane repeat protein